MEGIFATDAKILGAAKVRGYIGIEGIYDVPAIQKTFPTYRDWFLSSAFGPDSKWPAASPTLRPVTSKTPWLVIHSKLDELVDVSQSSHFAEHLRRAGVHVDLVVEDYGKHFNTVSIFDSADAIPDEAAQILKFIAEH